MYDILKVRQLGVVAGRLAPVLPQPVAGDELAALVLHSWCRGAHAGRASPRSRRASYPPLQENFDAAYNGNRAPLPIFIHTPWLERSNHLDKLKDFAGALQLQSPAARPDPVISFVSYKLTVSSLVAQAARSSADLLCCSAWLPWLPRLSTCAPCPAGLSPADYALSKPDVYFVTIRQLLAWMQNPIPADQLTPLALGCGNPGGAGPDPKTIYSVGGESAPAPALGVPAPAPGPADAEAPAPAPTPDESA